MRLPNAAQARVDREKVTEYLLSPSHPDGKSKAVFFAQFGFSRRNWEILAKSLQNHAGTHPVVGSVESAYGTRHTVDGPIESPDGRNPVIRTVWIIEKGSTVPRLVTAHPIAGRQS